MRAVLQHTSKPGSTASRSNMNSTPVPDDYSYDYAYNYSEAYTVPPSSPSLCKDASCIFLATAYVIIFFLGVTGNGLVIYIAGFRMKKSINTMWYMSLAVSDFLFCASLPFSVDYMVKMDWNFGVHMCKFITFIMTLNMFSSIFLLVVISVDRCVVVMFPVWAQNQRTIRKASVIVVLAWIFSTALSVPYAVLRDVQPTEGTSKKCFNNYQKVEHHVAMVTYRFIFGFLIPFGIIVVCYILITGKLISNQMARSNKPFKVMTTVVVAFYICWLPFHVLAFMELNPIQYHHVLPFRQRFVIMLASANSFLNPFLYAFLGKDFKQNCFALLSKIESAIEEEGPFLTL